MQFLVVLAVAVACAAADVSHIVRSDESLAPIVRSNYDSSPDGTKFEYAYETGNGIVAQADGIVKNPNSDEPTLEVKGAYKYVSPDGTVIETSYISNEGGFLPVGAHIPVSPPIPEPILRGLAYTAARAAASPVTAFKQGSPQY